jgi:hypothetical protein
VTTSSCPSSAFDCSRVGAVPGTQLGTAPKRTRSICHSTGEMTRPALGSHRPPTAGSLGNGAIAPDKLQRRHTQPSGQ